MFITLGFIVGFIAGWFLNDKIEVVVKQFDKLKFWKK